MARKKVREYNAKHLLKTHLARLAGLNLPIHAAQVKADTDWTDLVAAHPWLSRGPLVVKPDMLFGQRGKHDLVGLKLNLQQAEDFVRERMNKKITINGVTGPVTTFIVEPFVPHKNEYYLCISTRRLDTEVSFSTAGGIHIEDNWDKLKTIHIPTLQPVTGEVLAPLLAAVELEARPALERFLLACLAFFEDLDCTLLEMNPFTFDAAGQPFPLDMRLELDDTAGYRSTAKWGPDLEFPLPFGRLLSTAEQRVAELDENTGASLKLTILNPRGRVWLMVAGGGASVIYSDTVADLGFAAELGNYGEYSGAPNTNETYQYAKTVLEIATAAPDGRGRALLIGGGIANFTDVAATFKGIIAAIREKIEAIKAANIRIFVRRGGPNWQAGLAAMRSLGGELGIPVEVYGPDVSMTGICKKAIDYVNSSDAGAAA